MNNKELILIICTILCAGCIIAGAILLSNNTPIEHDNNISNVTNNTTNLTVNSTNITNHTEENNDNYKPITTQKAQSSSEYPKHVVQADGNEYDDAGPGYSEGERYRGNPTDAPITHTGPLQGNG